MDWETWEASPDIVEAFPYYKVGLDLDGLAGKINKKYPRINYDHCRSKCSIIILPWEQRSVRYRFWQMGLSGMGSQTG